MIVKSFDAILRRKVTSKLIVILKSNLIDEDYLHSTMYIEVINYSRQINDSS